MSGRSGVFKNKVMLIMNLDGHKYCSVAEAAYILRTSKAKIRYIIHAGWLSAIRVTRCGFEDPGNSIQSLYLITREELNWIIDGIHNNGVNINAYLANKSRGRHSKVWLEDEEERTSAEEQAKVTQTQLL